MLWLILLLVLIVVLAVIYYGNHKKVEVPAEDGAEVVPMETV